MDYKVLTQASSFYYDGKTAKRHEITLEVLEAPDGSVCLRSFNDYINRQDSIADLDIAPAIGSTLRSITYSDGARAESADFAGILNVENLLGVDDTVHHTISKIETRGKYALMAFVILGIISFGAYKWILPEAATAVAYKIPESALVSADTKIIASLENSSLEPSTLSPARQAEIVRKFNALKLPKGATHPKILFKSSDGQANAFTFIGGTVVMLDGIATLSKNDDEILGVLSHEAGHMAYKHSLRVLIQSSIIGFIISWSMGDVSQLITAAPVVLMTAGYSREFEREADAFSAETLRINGKDPAKLAEFLAKLDDVDLTKSKKEDSHHIGDYVNNHPGTMERIEFLKHYPKP